MKNLTRAIFLPLIALTMFGCSDDNPSKNPTNTTTNTTTTDSTTGTITDVASQAERLALTKRNEAVLANTTARTKYQEVKQFAVNAQNATTVNDAENAKNSANVALEAVLVAKNKTHQAAVESRNAANEANTDNARAFADEAETVDTGALGSTHYHNEAEKEAKKAEDAWTALNGNNNDNGSGNDNGNGGGSGNDNGNGNGGGSGNDNGNGGGNDDTTGLTQAQIDAADAHVDEAKKQAGLATLSLVPLSIAANNATTAATVALQFFNSQDWDVVATEYAKTVNAYTDAIRKAQKIKSAYDAAVVAHNSAQRIRPNETNAQDYVQSANSSNDSAIEYQKNAFDAKESTKILFDRLPTERRVMAQKAEERIDYDANKAAGWALIPTDKGVKITQLLFGLFNRPGVPSPITYVENDNCASVNAENAAHPRAEFGIQQITDEFNKKDCGYISVHFTDAQLQATKDIDLFASNDINTQVITILSSGVAGGINTDTVSTPDKCQSEFLLYSGWKHYITSKNDEFPATYNCENN
ncbi:hypothetical protein MS2017_0298 [Bathymodiolus thermophilus thioautotrophic gill symbiont]|uniref:Uncharacterized protein n=1 Tax=Bathymodiolus thermophilus thioautotrophic gill symbiont TaxID=2360 RepID=A0A3G3IKE1_9GAMM|nr:hypothetical protein [Bathymodiolus thermophilus thioautotrophic gill symbiont]AYQ56044.1 hypothetical protein MS2017_0294 [Bathymodiolus thermophilus thioautotrophic gill symbiont]AYQ56048.1 hypothetical protein MS2017_0298 [Bathymodiolus thermophilus thioautotrophic gill symbiont]